MSQFHSSWEVSQHIHIKSPGHHIDLEKVNILGKESNWFKRGLKEAIDIRAQQPILNKDGGRYKLPNSYDLVLTSLTSKVKSGDSADEGCSDYVLWSKVKFI